MQAHIMKKATSSRRSPKELNAAIRLNAGIRTLLLAVLQPTISHPKYILHLTYREH
jgi:hypothetical protein